MSLVLVTLLATGSSRRRPMSRGTGRGPPSLRSSAGHRQSERSILMHATFAGKLTGRVTKWMVLVFWLIALGVGGTFGSKLMDVQNNEASSWLPSSVESMRALERLTPFYDFDIISTVVAYE